jgi:hypothetical protein
MQPNNRLSRRSTMQVRPNEPFSAKVLNSVIF